MRPAVVTVSSATFSRWIPLNWRSSVYAIGLGVKLTSGAVLTYSVQHTFDSPWDANYEWSASRSTTVGTITWVAHQLSASDWVQFDAAAPFNAAYSVTSISDADTFVVTVANSGVASTTFGNNQAHKARVFSHADLAAKTVSADGNYAFPARAVRLLISAYTSGSATLTVVEAG